MTSSFSLVVLPVEDRFHRVQWYRGQAAQLSHQEVRSSPADQEWQEDRSLCAQRRLPQLHRGQREFILTEISKSTESCPNWISVAWLAGTHCTFANGQQYTFSVIAVCVTRKTSNCES